MRTIRKLSIITLGILLAGSPTNGTLHAADKPNVLIISIDDLNDWVGCLKGHPQARTPHIDRLAKRGTLFTNAHCQAPICTPSRASLVTGLYPSTSGLYFLQPGLKSSKVAASRPILIEHFAQAGYHTMGAGKFVHGSNEGDYYQESGGGMGGFGPLPEKKLTELEGLSLWDWGPFPEDESLMPDTKVADWVIERLQREHEKPFFLVAGFWRPHVPLYAPPKWFQPFPLDSLKLPATLDSDLDDISAYAKDLTIGLPAPRHSWFVEHDAWKSAVQAYLASIAFADHCVGRVLDALDSSQYSKNTIVVLLSDHGWHLGEKQRWAKRSLWTDSTRVPLVISAPGFNSEQTCKQPVGLIDIFPTLVDLADIPQPKPVALPNGKSVVLDGESLVPFLQNSRATTSRPALTTFCPNNHSLHSDEWHYIRYADGSEELYDHQADPHEWKNLANREEHASRLANFRRHLPTENAEPVIAERWQRWEIEAWRNAEKNSHQPARTSRQ